jgi:hypothetical protein
MRDRLERIGPRINGLPGSKTAVPMPWSTIRFDTVCEVEPRLVVATSVEWRTSLIGRSGMFLDDAPRADPVPSLDRQHHRQSAAPDLAAPGLFSRAVLDADETTSGPALQPLMKFLPASLCDVPKKEGVLRMDAERERRPTARHAPVLCARCRAIPGIDPSLLGVDQALGDWVAGR